MSYTEHRPERGGPAWIRGQALSLPQEAEGQGQKVDIEALLKEEKYLLYAKFLEEKVPPEVCTRCTKITKVSPPSAITLEGGKIKEYIVKTLLSLFSLCNNEPEAQNSPPNPAEISGEPSKILVNPVNSEQNLTSNHASAKTEGPAAGSTPSLAPPTSLSPAILSPTVQAAGSSPTPAPDPAAINPELIHGRIATFLSKIPKEGIIVGSSYEDFSLLLSLPDFSDLPRSTVEKEFKVMLKLGDLMIMPRADGAFAVAPVHRQDAETNDYDDEY